MLWLGEKGVLGESGVAQMIRRRCKDAGIPQLHPHQFRHTAAHEWLREDIGETNAMRLFGWRSRQMLSRYGAAAADERARDAFRRLAPGDRL
jgi:integrase